jgi:hypothetical protein
MSEQLFLGLAGAYRSGIPIVLVFPILNRALPPARGRRCALGVSRLA